MCMSTPDIPDRPPPKPPKPPAPPAPPASGPQGGAAETQGAPENPTKGSGKDKKRDRNSLRIPKNQSRGINLPGAGGKD